jgi:hypothetical protein
MLRLIPPPVTHALSEMSLPLLVVTTTAFVGLVVARWLYRFLGNPQFPTSRLPPVAKLVPIGLWLLLSFAPAIAYFAGFLAVKNTEGNIKKIATAMTHGYAADHDRYLPPQAIRDGNGKPLLSWRVAILPYLGHEDLYRQFHLDEPWDSPHNIQLLSKMPGEYEGNFLVQTPRGFTHFQVFTGFNTAFDRFDGYRVPDDFRVLGPSNTFLVVEATDPVPWTKPEDISYPYGALLRVGVERPKGVLGIYPSKGFVGAMVDGSVRGRLDRANNATQEAIKRAPELGGCEW